MVIGRGSREFAELRKSPSAAERCLILPRKLAQWAAPFEYFWIEAPEGQLERAARTVNEIAKE